MSCGYYPEAARGFVGEGGPTPVVPLDEAADLDVSAKTGSDLLSDCCAEADDRSDLEPLDDGGVERPASVGVCVHLSRRHSRLLSRPHEDQVARRDLAGVEPEAIEEVQNPGL